MTPLRPNMYGAFTISRIFCMALSGTWTSRSLTPVIRMVQVE